MRRMMPVYMIIRYMLVLLSLTFALGLTSCDVHEFPETPATRPVHLRLHYDTDMTEWKHLYDDESLIEVGLGETYDNARESGSMRYIIRTYPITKKSGSIYQYTQQFVIKQDISEGNYDMDVTLDLYPGEYRLMVWSDMTEYSGDEPYYNPDNFQEISLLGEHVGNEDYKDAFRGSGDISVWNDILEHETDTVDILMERPLAKYEFITTDLKDFIDKEQTRADAKSGSESKGPGDNEETKISIDDYRVVFYYVGFMPMAYSLFTDKPVDSSTGVLFESKLSSLSEAEASVGFDYVFVNGKESAVTVQIGIYDNEGTQLSMTEPIKVPLRRSHHTIMRGMFLMSEASGGVSINPDFDGDYNIVFP